MKAAKIMFAAVLGSIGLGLASPAAAEPILLDGSSVGDSYTINFDGFVDGGPSIAGLSSQLQLTLNSIVNGVYFFNYALTNTSATNDTVSSRVSSFAFNTDPEITGAVSTGTFGFTNLDSNYPNGIGRVDVCFSGVSTGSCAGGGSGGVFDGQSGTGTLALDFGGAISSLTLDDFFVRYQSVDGVAGVTSASGRQTSSGGTEVPAPGMFLIFAMALLALFLPRKRKTSLSGPQGALAPAFA